jgi:hypothetical protein
VLCEEARELIWNKVMVKWESVKAVSAELGVDQRRVAAVVRMKEVEKDWEANVSRSTLVFHLHYLLICPRFPDDTQKIRLVLKTAHKTHGYKKALRASLIETHKTHFSSSITSCLTQWLTSFRSTTGPKTGKSLLQGRPRYGAHTQLPSTQANTGP